jgi:hypothetical protein
MSDFSTHGYQPADKKTAAGYKSLLINNELSLKQHFYGPAASFRQLNAVYCRKISASGTAACRLRFLRRRAALPRPAFKCRFENNIMPATIGNLHYTADCRDSEKSTTIRHDCRRN